MNTRDIVNRVSQDIELAEAEAHAFQSAVLGGSVSEEELLRFFEALDGAKVSEPALKGFFRASYEAMLKVPDSDDSLDTCGTGGDGSGTFNISTAAGILLAAMGVPVAKHGNRAASSKCGSADVLEALGVKLEQTPERAAQILKECGFVFLFARQYHPAFSRAASARKTFGKRTYFNLLGPLLNPAGAKFRVHGLSDFSYAETFGSILLDSGVERVFFVHAKNGMDEASPFSDTQFLLLEKGAEPKRDEFPTSKYAEGSPDELLGGDVATSARILKTIFEGKGTDAQNSAVALNAGLGLIAYRGAYPYRNAVHDSLSALKSGIVAQKLAKIVAASNKTI